MIENPPGADRLSFRAGTYESFYRRTMALLRRPEVAGTANPLANLNHARTDGIVQAYAAAWAVLGDILTFYQERIINEGYLRTATEEYSVRNLVAQLDYAPQPALSARTSLSVTVAPQPGVSASVTIPARTQIMSVPAPGKLPVVFETDEELIALEAWNARTIARTSSTAQPLLTSGATQVRAAGVPTGVRPGMVVVLDGNDPLTGARTQCARVLTKVSAAANRTFTVLAWAEPLVASSSDPRVMQVVRIFVLRDSAKLFGASAPAWASVPVAVKVRAGATPRGGIATAGADTELVPSNSGLPIAPFYAACFSEDGTAWLAGDGGVFRSSDDAPGWQSAWSTVRRPYVRAIASNGDRVYAGTQRGDVYGSADGGASWYPIGAPDGIVPQKLGDALTKLPQSVVRCFAFVTRGSGAGAMSFVVAGTDRGVFVALDGGTSWVSQSSGLPGSSHAAMSSATVLGLCVFDGKLYAATSAGLFESAVEPSHGTLKCAWNAVHFDGAIAAIAASSSKLYAAGSNGVFVREGTAWRSLLAKPSVSLLCADGTALLAANGDALFRSNDGGATWKESPAAEPFVAAAVKSGDCVTVAPFDGFVESDWPGSEVGGSSVALDGNYPTLVAPAWLALVQDEPSAIFAAQIGKVVRAPVDGFGTRADVVTVALDPAIPAQTFARSSTRVAWNALACEPYLDTEDTTPLVSGSDMTLDGAAPPLDPGRVLAVSGKAAGIALTGSVGGVWKRTAAGWSAIGLEELDVWALARDASGALVAGATASVQRYDGASWTPIGSGFPSDAVVKSLALAGDTFFAGTRGNGLYMLVDATWRCVDAATDVRAIVSFGTAIVAATNGGARVTRDGGTTWFDAGGSIAGADVYALCVRENEIVAATRGGIHRSGDGMTWTPLAVQPSNRDCRALDLRADGTLYVGTVGGAFVSDVERRSWKRMLSGDVRAVNASDERVWWSVRAFGPYADADPVPIGTPNDVRALMNVDGATYAATLSRAVLTAADGSSTMKLDEPLIDPIDGSFVDDLDSATLSTALRAALLAIGIELSSSARITVIERSTAWSIDDALTHVRAQRTPDGNVNIYRDRVMELLAVPEPLAGVEGVYRYRLRDRDAFETTICATKDQVRALAAGTTYQTRSEIVTLDGMSVRSQATALTFSPPLSTWYDPATVVVSANVVNASHGESLPMDDVLGSGDATKSLQSFVLHKPPLSIFASPDGAGLSRALEIRVRGNLPNEAAAAASHLTRRAASQDRGYVVWREVDELSAAGPTDRVYTAREDETGVTTIAFGDGVHGRRLPTGSENVTASYRSGSGADGNVAAGSLALMRSRPPGVRNIRNPIPASGGAAAEAVANVALAAPNSTRTLDRIISLADYIDFSATFPGIAKATATLLAVSGWRGLVVTVAPRDGALLAAGDALFTTLATQIRGHRHAELPFRILCYRPAYVKIAVEVTAASDVDATSMSQAVEKIVHGLSDFDAAHFGKPLRASEIVTKIQQLAGVTAVRVASLHRSDDSPSAQPLVAPRAAGFDEMLGWLPAELVILDPRAEDALTIDVSGVAQ